MIDRHRERHALLTTLLRLSGQNGQAVGMTSTGEAWAVTSRTIYPDGDAAGTWCGAGLTSLMYGDQHPNAPTQQGFGHFDKLATEIRGRQA